MIKLFCIGKNKDKALVMLQDEYIKRLGAFDKVELVEFKDEPDTRSQFEKEAQRIKNAEGARVLEKIKADDFVILLDLHGKSWDSEGFARERAKWTDASRPLVFVIAGSLGPSEELVRRANVRWKISDLTFTHLMCRVLVLEQIYRSFMIEKGRHYHK
ncbi:23S rRNA (pseudouridine(1915)-N(3))-methyltransferase RlmH [Allobaculum mucilyticum]|uniref:23S rRNA (pseudouridine(1915)-N(3))-methyltransferase RlmH n=1 Tax=Allobaculum mucilyticum TaxID=2834459 RepID=UPI001E393F56|nr:23S rRNA (pseudouridine(1915)-N(3))-methyltransferase RlmH [Allobaculum mucilyticum]UNT95372.1 23S rRNA (pseudouridine(1915)-N(3))-methyltransferase RlmH [Allobaculum mucilyticum]